MRKRRWATAWMAVAAAVFVARGMALGAQTEAGATKARGHVWEVRRVVGEEDLKTAVEEFADPGRPGGKLRLSQEVLADESMVTQANVHETVNHDESMSIWLSPEDAWRLLAMQKQVGKEAFQTAVLIDGKVMDAKAWSLTLQDNGTTTAPYAIVYARYALEDRAAADALAVRLNAVARQRPGAVVRGQVLDKPGGKGVAGAEISVALSDEAQTAQYAVTDADGRYEFKNVPANNFGYALRLGKREAGVWTPGNGLRVEQKDIGRALAAEPLFTQLVMVSGRVVDRETLQPVAGMQVRISAKETSGSIETDAQGRYRFRVGPGAWQISAVGTRDRYIASGPRDMTLVEGKDVEMTDIALASAPAFDVEVTDAEGKPVANMPIATRINHISGLRRPGTTGGTEFVFMPSLKSDARGHARGYLNQSSWDLQLPLDGMKPYQTRLFARTDDGKLGGYLAVMMNPSETQAKPLQVRVGQTATLEFTVLDTAGKPDAKAKPHSTIMVGNSVYRNLVGEFPQADVEMTHLGEGRFRATGLIPGLEYVIGVYWFPGGEGSISIKAEPGEKITGKVLHTPPPDERQNTGAVTAQPAWDELAKLVGERLEAPAVKDFLTRQRLSFSVGEGKGQWSRYYSAPYSLAYREGKVDALLMRVYRGPDAYEQQMPVYNGPLPGGLVGGESREQVIARLGQPSSRDETAFEYDQQRLVLTFAETRDNLQVVSLTATSRPIFVHGPEKYFEAREQDEAIYGEKLPVRLTADRARLLFDDSPTHLKEGWEGQLAEMPMDVFRTSMELSLWDKPQLNNAVPPASQAAFARVMWFSDKMLDIRVLKPMGSLSFASYYQTEALMLVPRSPELDKVFDVAALEKKYAASYKGIQQGDSREKVISTLGAPEKWESLQDYYETLYFNDGRVKITIWWARGDQGKYREQVHKVSVDGAVTVPAEGK